MPIRHKFNGVAYEVAFDARRLTKRQDGVCSAPRPFIAIRPTARGRRRLELIIHEALHASDYDKPEAEVARTARDVAGLLWKLGYKK